MNPPSAARGSRWTRFTTELTMAVTALGGDRKAADASGVAKSVWEDTRKGRSIPNSNSWPAMLAVLESASSQTRRTVDWQTLYNDARSESGRPDRPKPTQPSATSGSITTQTQPAAPWTPVARSFAEQLDGLAPFALPSFSRLDLLSRALDDAGATPGRVWFVVGEGGLGKSVLLGQLGRTLALGGENRSAPGAAAVVLVTCASILSAADLSTGAGADLALGEAAAVHLPGPGPAPATAGLRDLVHRLAAAHGAVYLLVDTLDVILTEGTVDAVAAVLADAAHEAQLFLTCRTQEFEDLFPQAQDRLPRLGPHRCEALQIPKLTAPDITTWASAYVAMLDRSAEERERFIASLSDAVCAANVREVCAVPLRLALACDLYTTGDGDVPTDLTITGLFMSYWEKRIRRDRRGRRSSQSRAQEAAALQIATSVLAQSTERLSLTVDAAPLADDPGIRALLSEGVIRRRAGRNEFFHQSFAEFAVARLLLETGAGGQLARLGTALEDAHSHLWPVARHLLLQDASDDRYLDLQAAVPRQVAEGASIHVLAALARKSPELLAAEADTLGEQDPALLHSLVPLLANAPAVCAPTALEIGVPLLAVIGDTSVTEAARVIGFLLTRVDSPTRITHLSAALDFVAERRELMTNSQWLNLPESLVKPICSAGLDQACTKLLCSRYTQIGVNAQRAILRAGLALHEGYGEQAGRSEQWRAVAAEMLSAELPPEMSQDEYVALLRRCWQDERIREEQGWTGWREMLQADLPKRWDTAQVRLAFEFARDPVVRSELLSGLLGSAPLTFQDRWVNVSRFIADLAPQDVVAALLAATELSGRQAVGSAAALAIQIAVGLDRAARESLLRVLAPLEAGDHRRIWPAMIALAGDETDLHEQLLAAFIESDQESRQGADKADWDSARVSGLNTWLHQAPTGFLAQNRSTFRALLPAQGTKAAQRRAELEGRIALCDDQAHAWVESEVLQGQNWASAGTAVKALRRACGEGRIDPDSPVIDWLAVLLPTRHTAAAQQIAELLADEAAIPRLPPLEPTVVDRLCQAVDRREDSQLSGALIGLLKRLDSSCPLPVESVRLVLRKLSEPVFALPQRLKGEVCVQDQAEMTSEVSRWVEAVNGLGWHRLAVDEIEGVIRTALTGWDGHDLGTRVSRALTTVMRGMLARSPGFAGWLVDELWPATGPGTKSAIMDAFMAHERLTPTHFAFTLSKRPDCPAEIKARVLKQLG
jgi:hypothetical protein